MKIKDLPESIVDACRERDNSDETIEQASAIYLFTEYCEWHGLINWGRNLFSLARKLMDQEKKEAESTRPNNYDI